MSLLGIIYFMPYACYTKARMYNLEDPKQSIRMSSLFTFYSKWNKEIYFLIKVGA